MAIVYKGKPVEITVFKGTGIHEYYIFLPGKKLKDEHVHTKSFCQDGIDEDKDAGGRKTNRKASPFPIVAEYKNSKSGNEDDAGIECRITIDSRWSFDMVKKILSINIGVEEVELIKIMPKECPVEDRLKCVLAVDLGNTRTYALIADDIDNINGNGLSIHALPLKSYNTEEWKASDTGVFDSLFALTASERWERVKLKDSSCLPLSFMRLGREALISRRILAGKSLSGDFSLSSPKRYFWDNDNYQRGWKSVNLVSQAAESLNGPMPEELAKTFSTPHTSLPRASMVSGMMIELLEQTERFINSYEFMEKTRIFSPRLISDVCITYPAGWSHAERAQYDDKLRKGADAFCSSKGRSLPVPKINCTCEEASAVLLNYVYGETKKYGALGENWITAVGRKPVNHSGAVDHPSGRIAVIDIGGGTSDLVITHITDIQAGTGVDLQIKRIYQDGVNKAGDLFLEKVAKEIAVPKFAEWLVEVGTGDVAERARNTFREILNKYSLDPKVRNLTRTFWFPLSIEIVKAYSSNYSIRDNRKFEIKFHEGFIAECARDMIDIIKKWDELKMEGSLLKNTDNTEAFKFSIGKEQFVILEKITKSIFINIAKTFGAAISAFDCDIVLLAGKTSDIPLVKSIFESEIALPSSKIIPMKDYMIGDWCPLAVNGKIADSKISTVLGATIYILSNINSPSMRNIFRITTSNAPGIDEEHSLWGVVAPDAPCRFLNEKAILNSEKGFAIIPFNGSSIYLARKRFPIDSCDASPSYELRLDPGRVGKRRVCTAMVTIERQVNQGVVEIVITDVKGQFDDGMEVSLKDLEMRNRIFLEEMFWLDSGKIN